MLEQDIEEGLKTTGACEDPRKLWRWLLAGLGLGLGECLSTALLGVALLTMARDWPAGAKLFVGLSWYALSVGVAIVFFRRLRRDLGREHDPALPLWLLKGFGPFLAAPYLLLIPIFAAKQLPDPALWVSAVFLFSAPAWYAALAFYAAALWFRGCMTLHVELVWLTPIDESQLPEAARKFFNARQGEFEALGFDCVGNYLQKPIERQFSRVYLGADGKFVGETIYSESDGMKATSVFTLLADGKFIESADIDLGGPSPQSPMLFMQGSAGESVGEVLTLHGELVQKICADADTVPVSLEASQIEAASRYGVWLTMQELVRQGALSENPYATEAEEIQSALLALLPEPATV